jgi:hypothetical protein
VEHWPLRQLVVRTPRLELRPNGDAGLDELVGVAYEGVHPPEEMPFGEPWADADPRLTGRGARVPLAGLSRDGADAVARRVIGTHPGISRG